MRRRSIILAAVAVAVAAAIVVGIVTAANAGSPPRLANVDASQLLARMAQAHGSTQNVSGEVSWRNGLFGNLTAAASQFGMPAQNPLLASGSGRIWLSKAGMRVESQGSGGDQVAVASAARHDVWVYDYATSSARHIVIKGARPMATPPPAQGGGTMMTPAVITAILQRLAPLGSVRVSGQTTVAGRQAYVLAFTPAATGTAVGSVQAAVDGKTYLPLRLEVFARGGKTAALSFGFSSISYSPVPASRFSFTPPAGTKVTTQTVNAAAARTQMKAQQKQLKAQARKALTNGSLQRAFLTQRQAAHLVPFKLATASSSTRPFRAAFVFKHGMPLSALGSPVLDLSGLGAMGGANSSGGMAGEASQAGPAVVQVYGTGLGSIVLAQMPASGQAQSQLKQLPGVFGKQTVNGNPAAVVTTALGGAAMWRQGNTIVVAAGLVPAADLTAFAGSVR